MQAVIVSCREPEGLAEFWAAVLGWRVTPRSEDECAYQPVRPR